MRRIEEARPIRYVDGFVESIGDPIGARDIEWVEEKGYEVTETGVRGWGDYNCIISVRDGMEKFTYLAKLRQEMITRVDLVMPRGLRSKLSCKAYEDGKSEAEVVSDALKEFFDEEG